MPSEKCSHHSCTVIFPGFCNISGGNRAGSQLGLRKMSFKLIVLSKAIVASDCQ